MSDQEGAEQLPSHEQSLIGGADGTTQRARTADRIPASCPSCGTALRYRDVSMASMRVGPILLLCCGWLLMFLWIPFSILCSCFFFFGLLFWYTIFARRLSDEWSAAVWRLFWSVLCGPGLWLTTVARRWPRDVWVECGACDWNDEFRISAAAVQSLQSRTPASRGEIAEAEHWLNTMTAASHGDAEEKDASSTAIGDRGQKSRKRLAARHSSKPGSDVAPMVTIAFHFAIFTVICFPFGPIALIAGLMALGDVRRHPRLFGRGLAIFATVCGLIGTLALLTFIVFAAWKANTQQGRLS